MESRWGACGESYNEEVAVGEGGGEGCVVVVVDLNDGEVGVGGKRGSAGMSG